MLTLPPIIYDLEGVLFDTGHMHFDISCWCKIPALWKIDSTSMWCWKRGEKKILKIDTGDFDSCGHWIIAQSLPDPCWMRIQYFLAFVSRITGCPCYTTLPNQITCCKDRLPFPVSAPANMPVLAVSDEFSSSGDSKTEEEEKRSPKEKEGKEKDKDREDGMPWHALTDCLNVCACETCAHSWPVDASEVPYGLTPKWEVSILCAHTV